MHRNPTTFLLFIGMLVGCDSPKSSLGELPETSEGNTEPTDTAVEPPDTADDPTTSEPTSVTVTGEVHFNDVGAPCETIYFPQGLLFEDGNDDCASGMCLYSQPGPYVDVDRSCTTAQDCGVEHAICNETGHCQLDPAHVAARSMCTEACTEDLDCVGVDGTACEMGFACVAVAQLGPSCCQPTCVCRDDLDVEATNTLAQRCEAGTAEGCCDQEVVPEACGG